MRVRFSPETKGSSKTDELISSHEVPDEGVLFAGMMAEDYYKKTQAGENPSAVGSYFRTWGKFILWFFVFLFVCMILFWVAQYFIWIFSSPDLWVRVLGITGFIIVFVIILSIFIYFKYYYAYDLISSDSPNTIKNSDMYYRETIQMENTPKNYLRSYSD